jgi:hypothetical protein
MDLGIRGAGGVRHDVQGWRLGAGRREVRWNLATSCDGSLVVSPRKSLIPFREIYSNY